MTQNKLILYGDANWISPYVFSTFVALREKKLDFETKLLRLEKRETFEPIYRDRSLTGRVPALVHDEFWLSESSAIDEYLEDAFPPPRYPRLYPAGARERARARQIQAWLRSDLAALREERSTTTLFYRERVPPLGPEAQSAADRLVRAVDRVLPAEASAVFGEFSIVDADLALMLHRLIVAGDPVPARVRTYAEGIWQRPSVRDFVERPRPPRA